MEQFTKKAASALKLAAKAARRRGHSYIGSEHLLLGLLEEGEGTAAQVLIGAGVEEEKLKSLIDQLIAPVRGYAASSHDGRESPEALPGHSGQHGHPGGGLPGDEPGSQKCKPE